MAEREQLDQSTVNRYVEEAFQDLFDKIESHRRKTEPEQKPSEVKKLIAANGDDDLAEAWALWWETSDEEWT